MGGLEQYSDRLPAWFDGVTNFVETGCYKGDGLKLAQAYCQNLFSCDIHARWARRAQRKVPSAIIEIKPSDEFLAGLLPALTGRTFFWLDAHFPEQYGVGQSTKEAHFPMVKELDLIRKLKRGWEQDTILCDDIRVIQSEDNPARCAVGEHKVRPEHLVRTQTFADLVEPFADTHTFEIVGIDALLLTPKA